MTRAARTTADGRPVRKCREDCLAGSTRGECQCVCGFNCHGRGECDPELHRFDRDGFGRTPRTEAAS